MRLSFSETEFLEIEIEAPSASSKIYDCEIRAQLVTESFSGKSSAWIDRMDLKAFVEEARQLMTTLNGRAIIGSESPGEFFLELKAVDRLGHFVLKLLLGKVVYIYSEACELQVKYAHPFEAEAVDRICGELIHYFEHQLGAD